MCFYLYKKCENMCFREGENLMMFDESLGMGCGGRYDERKRDD